MKNKSIIAFLISIIGGILSIYQWYLPFIAMFISTTLLVSVDKKIMNNKYGESKNYREEKARNESSGGFALFLSLIFMFVGMFIGLKFIK